ncbi:hypothetical protein ABEB36_002300 [Hypothenemus hampei]|uniref:C2H2-type domain-containing protein n=1 Tax=Hypothenemus hampei TaxID=57062 RepID=A0ABD1F5B3_HYPHA
MSTNENPPGEAHQTPVETFKCSQCNFYTNHEYYLHQHNFTHGLQALMAHHKRNSQQFDDLPHQQESSVKIQEPLEPNIMLGKLLQCLYCAFETDQEEFYKQHLLTHSTHLALNSYGLYKVAEQGFNDNFPSTANVSPQNSSPEKSCEFDSISIKEQDMSTALESFRCSIDCCTYETENENAFRKHSLSHEIVLVPEPLKPLKCDFESNQEKKLENISESILIVNNIPQREVFRCNNCEYETNLKAFLKRHMLIHSIKQEIQDETLETYHCNQCNFETHHDKYLRRHELSHQQLRPLKCVKCSFETLYKRMYLLHMKAHKSKSHEKKTAKRKINYIKCDECSFQAPSMELIDVHKKIKHSTHSIDSNLFNCPYCKYQTNWEPCLKRHIDREHPNKQPSVSVKKEIEVKVEEEPEVQRYENLFRCHDCDFSSKSKQYLILHLKRSHLKTETPDRSKSKLEKRGRFEKSKTKGDKGSGKLFECKFRNCTFQTSIKSNYLHHLRKHQSQNPQRIMFHFCDLCDFIAKTEDNLAEHKRRTHLSHLRLMYKCTLCDFKTAFKHNLKSHSIKHKKYTCDVCDEELDSAYALVKHRKGHQINHRNRIYLCDVCGFQSKNDRSLKMHKKTHNPEFKCPDCPFQTHSKVNFQNHCINHKSADEVTMFPCPHCSYQSRLKRNLAWHMKRHADPSKAQIFKCPTCEYQTFTNAQLKSHLMVHKTKEEVVMLKCDFCPFETKRKSNMVQHRLRHLKDSPDVPLLSCPDCNYTTVAKRHLNKHRKTHNVNPDKMFQCTFCPYKIHRKIYLMRHMENHKTVETFGNDQWQRYTFPPQPPMTITGVTVVPNLGQNIQNHNLM